MKRIGLALLWLAACGGRPPGSPCTDPGQCAAGTVCYAQVCRKECTIDADCSAGVCMHSQGVGFCTG
jgi:hypothetical protein